MDSHDFGGEPSWRSVRPIAVDNEDGFGLSWALFGFALVKEDDSAREPAPDDSRAIAD